MKRREAVRLLAIAPLAAAFSWAPESARDAALLARVAQEGQSQLLRRRRVLQQLPRFHGVGILLEPHRDRGRGLHRQHLRRRVEGLSSGGAHQARRPLRMSAKRLGIGFVGSGFNAKFHLQAFRAVRDADVLGVWSPNAKHAEETAALARQLDVGETKPYNSIAAMVADPAIQALC